MKIEVSVDYDWVSGYLKYGHREGILNIPDEEYEEFKNNPDKYLEEKYLMYNLDFILDDYRIEDLGDYEVSYKEIDE